MTNAVAPSQVRVHERAAAAGAPSDGPPAAAPQLSSGTGALVLLGVVAAAFGVTLLATRGHQSKVIGSIDGVALLSNPRLPFKYRNSEWAVPEGTLFATKGPKVSIEHGDQNHLPDCGGVSGGEAVADTRPEAITSILEERPEHVIIRFAGREPIAVTKELPLGLQGEPEFAGAGMDDPVFWMGILEKGLAAVRPDGYRSLTGITAHEVMNEILGGAARPVRSRGTIVDDLEHNLAKPRTPIAATVPARLVMSPRQRELAQELNIHGSHYYVVQRPEQGQAPGTFRFFNPWGESHPERPLTADEVRTMFDGIDTPDEYIRY